MSLQDMKDSGNPGAKGTQLGWERFVDGFYNGACSIQLSSPGSSPPDIFWSSSGSSELQEFSLISSRSRARHRVVTRLNFDSCVVQNSNVSRHYRASVSRNVIDLEVSDHQMSHPVIDNISENSFTKIPEYVSNNNAQNNIINKNRDSLLENCDVSDNFMKNFNEADGKIISDQKSLNENLEHNLTVTSPLIGNRKKCIGEIMLASDSKRCIRKKRRRKTNQALNGGETSPLIGSCKKNRTRSLSSKSNVEEKADLMPSLKLNTDRHNIEHNFEDEGTDMLLVYSSQQSAVLSSDANVQRLRHKKHKWKHSICKKLLEVTHKLDQCEDEKINLRNLDDGQTCGNLDIPSQNLTVSPVFGKDKNMKARRRKRRLMRKSIVKNIFENGDEEKCKGDSTNKISPILDRSFEHTPQKRKSKRDSGICNINADKEKRMAKLKEVGLQNSDVNTHSVLCMNVVKESNMSFCIVDRTDTALPSALAVESSLQENSETNANNYQLLISGKNKSNVKCESKLTIDETGSSSILPNSEASSLNISAVSARKEGNKCKNGKINNFANSNAPLELEIECETSQEISTEYGTSIQKENCAERYSRISSPVSSSESRELLDVMISSCSTPPSQKTGAQNLCEQGDVEQYLDSAKRKRIKLNRSGLASRLKKLLARKHSSTRIWKHEANHLNTLRSNNKGMLLAVHSVWREYSHSMVHCSTLLGKHLIPQNSEDDDVNLGIVIVLDIMQHPQIKPGSTLRIYPPWQTLSVSRLNLILVLGVSCVEEVDKTPQHALTSQIRSDYQVQETLYTCPCACLQEQIAGKKCQFQFQHNGLEFLEHLLPQEMLKETVGMDPMIQVRGTGTIAAAVINQGCLLTGDSWLQLCVLKVFRYKSRCNNSNNKERGSNFDSVCWSILGCDAVGECCEVVLGSDPFNSENWINIVNRTAIGQLYRLTGFTLMKRIHRTKNLDLWSLINRSRCGMKEGHVNENINEVKYSEIIAKDTTEVPSGDNAASCSKSNNVQQETSTNTEKYQLFLYVLSPGIENWEMEKVSNEQNVALPTPELDSLVHTLRKDDGAHPVRETYLVKLIYVSEGYLFVTDTSLGQADAPGYMIVVVKPSCFIPSDITGMKATVVFLQDIHWDKGILIADKYSWIVPVSSKETIAGLPCVSEQVLNTISSVEIKLPNLTVTPSVRDLVTVAGIISNVDEETAFAWPVCGICENDLLVELDYNKYLCQECNESSQIITKMSLEVFVSCPQIPAVCKVKVKLQQDSILKLLPASQDNNKGYELTTVLGHTVGPLYCEVMKIATNNFILSEIPAFSRHAVV